MDLLASLNLDALPEQQTRTSRSSVADALASNPDIKLGFDACTNCAATTVSVDCKGCGRVSYCSKRCREEDANPSQDETDETQQHGHGSVVCALLRLCDKDECVDEGREGADQDAEDRVRSEYESYPATIANILMDGPCYQTVLSKKQSGSAADKGNESSLTIHVVGASSGVELWGDHKSSRSGPSSDVYGAYAEAVTELAEEYKLKTIRLIFIGPDCLEADGKEIRKVTSLEDTSNKVGASRLIVEAHKSNYNSTYLKKGPSSAKKCPPPAADIIVFFNPGFTCPDYTWDKALSCIQPGTPFLVTTNTEMEGVADCQYLFERDFIAALPPMIADILGGESDDNDDGEGECVAKESGLFFGENPYAGSRVRQSGNMANDLFVKNRWMFGGIFGKSQGTTMPSRSSQKRSPTKNDSNGTTKRHKLKSGSGNSKKSNPALI